MSKLPLQKATLNNVENKSSLSVTSYSVIRIGQHETTTRAHQTMKLRVYMFPRIGNNYVTLDGFEISYQEGSRQLTIISHCTELSIFRNWKPFLQKS